MIFTTNKSVGSWGKLLHDEDLAQALVDRAPAQGIRGVPGRLKALREMLR